MIINKIVVLDSGMKADVSAYGDECKSWGWSIGMACEVWSMYRMLNNDPINLDDFVFDSLVDGVLFLSHKEEIAVDEVDVDFSTSVSPTFFDAWT